MSPVCLLIGAIRKTGAGLGKGAAMRVEQLRGGVVEAWHDVHVAVVDATGRLVARVGDPDLVTFWRSAAKPFQAVPLVEDRVMERFALTAEELALACASHSSEPGQVTKVRELLAKIGCSERDLLCGPHAPLSERVAQDYQSRGVRLTAVYSNCSGKHAGMLALARHHGWPTAFYTRPEHPVQQRCLAEVSRWTSVPSEKIQTGVDGCGVVCFALPLRNMALAYAKLGSGEQGAVPADANRAPAPRSPIVQSMLHHPELIAGEGRPCTELMRAHPGRVIAKVGAEGVYCALLVGEGLGVALKVTDGHALASALAIAAVLEAIGLRPAPPSVGTRPNLNTRGEPVGELRVNGGLEQ
ncbi:MAG: asparaginase [Gemmatimonadetes bacterium]|nr:MAG: asparaginase [Gemmatimonadota bacterium]TLY56681.1 MAG: asparaginase [Gemmatimonadota bacterium]